MLIILLEGGFVVAFKKSIEIYRKQGLRGVKRGIDFILEKGEVKIKKDSIVRNRNDYTEWVRRYDTLNEAERLKIKHKLGVIQYKPKISIVTKISEPEIESIMDFVESIRTQIYSNWELCIAVDVLMEETIRSKIAKCAEKDYRISVFIHKVNEGKSTVLNESLKLITGEWVFFLEYNDLLAECALFWIVETINRVGKVNLIYGDEDKISESGVRFDPYFKCDWNPELFYSHNMISSTGIYCSNLIRKIGGFRPEYNGAEGYDLAFRCIENIQEDQIVHIPKILCHKRVKAKKRVDGSELDHGSLMVGMRAISEHLCRTGVKGKVAVVGDRYQVEYLLPETPPLVSIIIPTRNGNRLLKKCINSILRKTNYPNYEILIVDNGSDDVDTINFIRELSREQKVRVVRDDSHFNYSYLNNKAVDLSMGELVALLNDDIEVITPNWLSVMVSHAVQPQNGAVGAKLWYSNNTLQHGGVILGIGGLAGHAHKHFDRDSHGYACRMRVTHNVSAVTAACLVLKKSIYIQVGKLDEVNLPIAFNDVDLCLRILEAGYRNVWTPCAELFHHESATRGYEDTLEKKERFKREACYLQKRWGDKLYNDPAYSPNLTLDHEDFSYAWPPRV